jgi:putative heme-binding domain-containing protein
MNHRKCRRIRWCVVVCLAAWLTASLAPVLAATPDYFTVDPEVRHERIDSSPNESFLSMRVDSAGRLFVGGREAVFVYEPLKAGGFAPRRELLRFPPHSWVYDLGFRGNDLYVLTRAALYVVPDGAVKRDGLQPKKLLWGIPQYHVHQCFHALAWGPQGDLFISMGDTLVPYGNFDRPDHWGHWNFFTPNSKEGLPYTGQGGVLRIRPDGSGLQVVARGLRNCCGLTFDRDWNLFGNDNDHESLPQAYVPGRLIHITPHSDFGWPRGWMPHITPDRADLLQTMFDGMGRAVPVGEAYLDSPAWPAKFRNNLLLARWGIRAVMRYPIEPRGASFRAEEHPLLIGKNQARPVGVTVGPDGSIYAAIAFMAHNEGSPIYASDLVRLTPRTAESEKPIERFEISARSSAALYDDLSNPVWEVRRRAHLELLRRGGEVLKDAAGQLAAARSSDLADASLIWLAATSKRAPGPLLRLSEDSDPKIRLQAVRALHEFFVKDDRAAKVLTSRMADADPHVALAATLAFFDTAVVPWDLVARVGRTRDTYLRQAACMLLAERAPLAFLQSACGAVDEQTRLVGVLAAGFRLTLPPAMKPIASSLPLSPWDSEDVYRVRYFDETVDLRKLGRLGMFTVAEHWKAGGHTHEQEALFGLLRERLADSSEPTRLQAAHFLSLLEDPRSEPLIAALLERTERRRLANAPLKQLGKMWTIGPFDDGKLGLSAIHPPEKGPVDLTATYDSGGKTLAWKSLRGGAAFDFRKAFGRCDRASFYAYCRIESPIAQQMMLLPGSDDGLKVWVNGQPVWTHAGVRAALPLQDVVFVDLEPGSNDLLLRVNNVEGDCMLYAHYRTRHEVSVTLPEKLGNSGLAARLRSASAGTAPVGPEFLSVNWLEAVSRGNADRGRKLFSADGIGCAKCHAIDGTSAAVGGPSLANASARFTVAYLVESVLAPSRSVAPVFRATSFVLRDGKTLTGLVLSENSEKIELLCSDATRKKIARSDIEVRKLQDISPMPAGLVKTPEELRDLLAFLLRPK